MDVPLCTMSWGAFAKYITGIKTLSDELADGWVLHGDINVDNRAYISKKVQKSQREGGISEESRETPHADEGEGGTSVERAFLVFEYHVVFSPTYCSPMLCFNAWKTNGALLSLEECWQRLGFSDSEHKYTTLTQMEHPVVMRPFLTLHPCKTAELIAMSFEKSKNHVVSWLSSVGPTVGLILLPDYAKLTF